MLYKVFITYLSLAHGSREDGFEFKIYQLRYESDVLPIADTICVYLLVLFSLKLVLICFPIASSCLTTHSVFPMGLFVTL